MEREDAQSIGELLWCHRGHELVRQGVIGLELIEVAQGVLLAGFLIFAQSTAARGTPAITGGRVCVKTNVII